MTDAERTDQENAYLEAVGRVLALSRMQQRIVEMQQEIAQERRALEPAVREAIQVMGCDPMGLMDKVRPNRMSSKTPAEPRKRRVHVDIDLVQGWLERRRHVTVGDAMSEFDLSLTAAFRKLEDLAISGKAVRVTELRKVATENHEYRHRGIAPNGPTDPVLLNPERPVAEPVAGTGQKTRWATDDATNDLLHSLGPDALITKNGGHIKVTHRQTGKTTTVSSSPGVRGRLDKVRNDLRSIGFQLS